jgi:hypothetical protein
VRNCTLRALLAAHTRGVPQLLQGESGVPQLLKDKSGAPQRATFTRVVFIRVYPCSQRVLDSQGQAHGRTHLSDALFTTTALFTNGG